MASTQAVRHEQNRGLQIWQLPNVSEVANVWPLNISLLYINTYVHSLSFWRKYIYVLTYEGKMASATFINIQFMYYPMYKLISTEYGTPLPPTPQL